MRREEDSWPRLNEIPLVRLHALNPSLARDRFRDDENTSTRHWIPQHARPGTTSRDESVIPMPTLSLDMPPGIACPCIVLGAFSGRISERREVSALYCQWFLHLVRVDCQFLNTHKTRSTENATTKWGA